MPDQEAIELFVRVLAIDREVAGLLVAHEMKTLEEVAYVPEEELREIEGLDPNLVPLVRQRAKSYLQRGLMDGE
jgi:N utilization substance protein A